jgi:hypothetical protein
MFPLLTRLTRYDIDFHPANSVKGYVPANESLLVVACVTHEISTYFSTFQKLECN